MNKAFVHLFLAAINLLVFADVICAQTGIRPGAGLFDNDSVFQMTLSGNIRDLLNDRSDNSQYHPLVVSYMQENGKEFFINAEAKTRGHFRKQKENCTYPPLLLHFTKSDTLQASVFNEQQKLKLVMPCKDDDYVVREWLVYKLYNLVTPKSFRARLVRVTMDDNKGKKNASFFGILVEGESQVAKRNSEITISSGMKPEATRQDDFLTMAMFEYMIANTDWSVQYLQNIKLIAPDSTTIPSTVPYDFDHAGIVNAPYALPAEELQMSSVRERRYRGYCMEYLGKFDSIIAVYNKLKPAFYNLYTSCTLLDPKYVKSTIKYLDDFYAIINDPAAFQKEFSYPCNKNGTGNVVIKGLKEE